MSIADEGQLKQMLNDFKDKMADIKQDVLLNKNAAQDKLASLATDVVSRFRPDSSSSSSPSGSSSSEDSTQSHSESHSSSGELHSETEDNDNTEPEPANELLNDIMQESFDLNPDIIKEITQEISTLTGDTTNDGDYESNPAESDLISNGPLLSIGSGEISKLNGNAIPESHLSVSIPNVIAGSNKVIRVTIDARENNIFNSIINYFFDLDAINAIENCAVSVNDNYGLLHNEYFSINDELIVNGKIKIDNENDVFNIGVDCMGAIKAGIDSVAVLDDIIEAENGSKLVTLAGKREMHVLLPLPKSVLENDSNENVIMKPIFIKVGISEGVAMSDISIRLIPFSSPERIQLECNEETRICEAMAMPDDYDIHLMKNGDISAVEFDISIENHLREPILPVVSGSSSSSSYSGSGSGDSASADIFVTESISERVLIPHHQTNVDVNNVLHFAALLGCVLLFVLGIGVVSKYCYRRHRRRRLNILREVTNESEGSIEYHEFDAECTEDQQIYA